MPNILISFCRQNSILLSILCCFVEWPVKYSPFFKLLPLLSVGEVLDGIQTAEGFLLQTCYSPNHQNLYYQYPIISNDIVTKRIFFSPTILNHHLDVKLKVFLRKLVFPPSTPMTLRTNQALSVSPTIQNSFPPKKTNVNLFLLFRLLSQEKLRSSQSILANATSRVTSVMSPTTDQLLDRHGQTNIELGPTKQNYLLLSKSLNILSGI